VGVGCKRLDDAEPLVRGLRVGEHRKLTAHAHLELGSYKVGGLVIPSFVCVEVSWVRFRYAVCRTVVGSASALRGPHLGLASNVVQVGSRRGIYCLIGGQVRLLPEVPLYAELQALVLRLEASLSSSFVAVTVRFPRGNPLVSQFRFIFASVHLRVEGLLLVRVHEVLELILIERVRACLCLVVLPLLSPGLVMKHGVSAPHLRRAALVMNLTGECGFGALHLVGLRRRSCVRSVVNELLSDFHLSILTEFFLRSESLLRISYGASANGSSAVYTSGSHALHCKILNLLRVGSAMQHRVVALLLWAVQSHLAKVSRLRNCGQETRFALG